MAQPEKPEEARIPTETEALVSPSLNRRQFLALCAAGASAMLFGAACGAGGEDEDGGEGEDGGEDGQEQEQDDENGGGEEGGDDEQDEGGY